jgi:DNA-binding protein HU-beta
MTKSQMLAALSEKAEVSKKQAGALVDAMIEMAYSEVKKNGVFAIAGLGKLVKVNRKARIGRNPATGESIKIPAKTVVKFRLAKAAKEAVL